MPMLSPSPRLHSITAEVDFEKQKDGSVTPRARGSSLGSARSQRSGSLGLMPEDLPGIAEEMPTMEENQTWPVGDVVDAAGYGRFQHGLMIQCGAVWMADAMEMMLMSFLLPRVAKQWDLDHVSEGMIMTCTFLGMLIGAYLWGIFSDKYGRRKGYLATAGFTAVFGLLSAAAPNWQVLALMRFFVGIGLGGAPVAFSLFAEFVPTAHRGQTLVMLEGIFWTGGALFEALLAYLVLDDGMGLTWPWLLIFSAIPLILICGFYPQLPESPRWLVMVGREEEAKVILKQVAEMNYKNKPMGAPLPADFNLLMPSGDQTSSIMDLFSPNLRVTTCLLWVIWFANVLTYYGIVLVIPYYFGKDECEAPPVEFDGNGTIIPAVNTCSDSSEGQNEYLAAFINTLAELPGLFVCVMLIDRAGRKMTQCYLFLEAAVCTLLMNWTSLPMAFKTLFAMGARMGYSGAFLATFVYTPEVYPTSVRTTGLGAASAMGRVAGMLTDYIANEASYSVHIPCIIYGIVALIAAFASYSLPIETGGAALADDDSGMGMELESQGAATHLPYGEDGEKFERLGDDPEAPDGHDHEETEAEDMPLSKAPGV